MAAPGWLSTARKKCGNVFVTVSYTHLDVYKRQTLFWLPLHAQEAGKEFRPAGEPISYAEKDNRKKSPEPLEDQKDKLKKQRIITAKGRVTDAAGEPLIGVNVLIKESGTCLLYTSRCV